MRCVCKPYRLLWVIQILLFAFLSHEVSAKGQNSEGNSDSEFVSAERPFDAVSIFGDFGKSARLPGTNENKVWWERMVRGEVGKDRFLILCALKDGNWKRLGDIRDFVEFQIGNIYPVDKLEAMINLMSEGHRTHLPDGKWERIAGEGWLEKNSDGTFSGINSKWRIEPSVLPLLYFLLMGCTEENRCR